MRARSRSSMAAIVARPPRLMLAQLVELGVDAVADEAALAHERRRVVDQRALDRPRRGRAAGRAPSACGARAGPGTRRAASAAAGRARSDVPSATRSRGPAVPSVTRPRMRSRSWTPRERLAQPAAVERRGRPAPRRRRAGPGCARARRGAQDPLAQQRGRPWRSACGRARRASVPRRPPSARLSTSSRLRRVSASSDEHVAGARA